MREPAPEGVRRTLRACRELPPAEVLTSDGWAELREHCAELAVELDALGHRTIARRVDRDYARLHEQLRAAIDTSERTTRCDLPLADAVEELASTLAAIGRFHAVILAAGAVNATNPADSLRPELAVSNAPPASTAATQPPKTPFDGAGGPEPDPHDTRRAVWMGKYIYLGNDTQVSRLFWLLAKPLGAARTLGQVQRAIDGMETDRDCAPQEVERAGQRVRKALSKLRAALREAELDDHVLIVRAGTQAEPEYSMVRRYSR